MGQESRAWEKRLEIESAAFIAAHPKQTRVAHQFTCESCSIVYYSETRDESMQAEALGNFGSECEGPMHRVCHDCYAEIMARGRELGLIA